MRKKNKEGSDPPEPSFTHAQYLAPHVFYEGPPYWPDKFDLSRPAASPAIEFPVGF